MNSLDILIIVMPQNISDKRLYLDIVASTVTLMYNLFSAYICMLVHCIWMLVAAQMTIQFW